MLHQTKFEPAPSVWNSLIELPQILPTSRNENENIVSSWTMENDDPIVHVTGFDDTEKDNTEATPTD